MQLLLCAMCLLLPSLILVQTVLMCMSKYIQIVWWISVNATNVCTNSCDLKPMFKSAAKPNVLPCIFKVDREVDIHLLLLHLYHNLQPNDTAKSLQKDSSVHLFAYNGSATQFFDICPLQVHFKNNCFVVNFYVVGKGKLILGLESSRKLGSHLHALCCWKVNKLW